MERKKQISDEALRLNCLFGDICQSSIPCNICVDKGLHYLVVKAYLPKTGIPRAYLLSSLSDLSLSGEASTEVPVYLENIYELVNSGKGFYAHSNEPGTGKTTVGCIALKHYLYWSLRYDPFDTDNRRVLYLNVPEFLDRIRKSFNQPDLELDQLMDELKDLDRAPRLVLFDDIGAEKPSDWVRERLYTLINFRVSNGLACLYTSNNTLERLAGTIGKRSVSRIAGSTKPLLFGGRDRRRLDW